MALAPVKLRAVLLKILWTDDHDREEKAILQRIVNEIYEDFIATVAAGRKMDAGKLRSYADGRIYTGAQAKKHWLD